MTSGKTEQDNTIHATQESKSLFSLAERLYKIFRGNDRSHGSWDFLEPNPKKNKMEMVSRRLRAKGEDGPDTPRRPVTPSIWVDHMMPGKPYLGIVPILDDETCWFGIIEVDEYGDDVPGRFAREVTSQGMPLTVSRSKSGGAHLTLTLVKALPVKFVRAVLNDFRIRLGLPESTEIFPKQGKDGVEFNPEANLGNWINMPLADGDAGDRRVITHSGFPNDEPVWLPLEDAVTRYESMRCDESFLKAVLRQFSKSEDIRETTGGFQPDEDDDDPGEPSDLFYEAPPCLKAIYDRRPVNENRNDTMFDVIVYLKRRFPKDWQSKIANYNEVLFKDKLTQGELDSTVIRSNGKKDYSFLCKNCDHATCRMRRYGTGFNQDGLTLWPKNPWKTARKIIQHHRTDAQGRMLLRFHKGTFYGWITNGWYELHERDVMGFVGDVLESATARDAKGYGPFPFGDQQLRNITTALERICRLDKSVKSNTWLGDPTGLPEPTKVIPLRNGIYDLEGERLIPCTPDFFNHYVINITYDKDAKCPRTDWFIDTQIWPNDPASVETYEEFCGLFLTSDTSYEKALLLKAPSRGGKGTLIDIASNQVGEENVSAITMTALNIEQFPLAPLIGKSLVSIGDLKISNRVMPAGLERFLTLLGRDRQYINRKGKEQWVGKLFTRVIMATTDSVNIDDPSNAFANRVIVLAWDDTWAGREDHTIKDAVTTPEERAGFFLRAVRGWKRLNARGKFDQPESGRQYVEEMRTANAPMLAFLRMYYIEDPYGMEPKEDLFDLWARKAVDFGGVFRGNSDAGRLVKQAMPQIRDAKPRPHPGGKQVPAFGGIRRMTQADHDRNARDAEQAMQPDLSIIKGGKSS